jgi:hypothetical protein
MAPPPVEPTQNTVPVLQPDGTVVYTAPRDFVAEAAAHCIIWLFDHPQVLGAAAAVAACFLVANNNPKRRSTAAHP